MHKYVVVWRMDQDASASFGKVLRYLRVASGLTQDELSQRSGVSTRGIRRLETGDRQSPRLETVRLLAEAMALDEPARKRLLNTARPELDARPLDAEPGRVQQLSSLPVPLTPFVGREETMDAIVQMLLDDDVRLLTITGPPGIGKTRLAVEVGRALIVDFPDGVRFVSLAPLAEASLVVPRVVEAQGAGSPQRDITLDDLAAWIGNAQLLLVLDNFEHVLPAAPFVPELLARCPHLRVIVTSRTRLRVSGEHRFPVPPLRLPANGAGPDVGHTRSEAEELFVMRARSVEPNFEWTAQIAPLVADICRRVDGLPLAIELAAAQLGGRSLADVAARMQPLLPVLEGGPRDQPERLQTMTKSIEWSYSLLSPDEQRLLRRVSVFRGGFALEAAADLDSKLNDDGSGSGRAAQTSLTIASLVEKHLIIRTSPTPEQERFSLLELIREYAGEMLHVSGEVRAVRDAHAGYFLTMAVQSEVFNWISMDPTVPRRFEPEMPNFREAPQWLEASGDGERMLALAGALRWFWIGRTDLKEGEDWLERALALAEGVSPAILAKALIAAGQLDFYRGDLDRTAARYELAFEAAMASGDTFVIAWACSTLAAIAAQRGDFSYAKFRGEQAQEASQLVDDAELAQAMALGLSGTLGRSEHGLGNLDKADAHLRRGVEHYTALGHSRGAGRVFGAWGTLAVDQGDLMTALERYQLALHHAVDGGEQPWIVFNLRMIGALLALLGEYHQAARLVGACESLERRTGITTPPTEMDRRVESYGRRRIDEALDANALAEAMAEGAALSLDQAVEFATTIAVNDPASTVQGVCAT